VVFLAGRWRLTFFLEVLRFAAFLEAVFFRVVFFFAREVFFRATDFFYLSQR
jgi:hypothetical protein